MKNLLTSTVLIIFGVGMLHCAAASGEESPRPETEQSNASHRGSTSAHVPADQFDAIIESFNQGVGLMGQYQPVKAVQAFEQVVRLAPDWLTGHLNLGIALLNSEMEGCYGRAEEAFGRVLEQEPKNRYAHYSLGILLRHLSRSDEAVGHFERVLEVDPDDPDAHYQLGLLLEKTDSNAARAHLEKTLEELPHHESACYRLQKLLRKAGEVEASKELLLRFQALKKSGAGVFSGMEYGEMGRYAEVIRAFDSPDDIAQINPAPTYTNSAKEAGFHLSAPGSPGRPPFDQAGRGAQDFGPGVAVADVDGDGDLDCYIAGLGKTGQGALYINNAAQFSLAANTGIIGASAIGAYFGDYDADGDPDLYLTCAGPNRLYQNAGKGEFVDVSQETGTGGGAFLSLGATWSDADHDGDLDFYCTNFSRAPLEKGDAGGAPNALWRNNGDGTFTDVAAKAGVDGGTARSVAAIFFDVDEDRDLDLYLVNYGAPNQLFLNDRMGRYTDATTRFPELADAGPGLGALLSDFDLDGREDILLLRGTAPPRLFLRIGRERFIEDAAFGAAASELGKNVGALAGDLDLDGDVDIVFLDAGYDGNVRHQILMNDGAGRFGPPVFLGNQHETPASRGAVIADFGQNGSLDLLVACAGRPPEFWSAPPTTDRGWLEVLPLKANVEGASWIEPSAVGLLVEVKTGHKLQVASVNSAVGYLGSAPRSVHFGLGRYGKADYVRFTWPDGVIQSELEVPGGQPWQQTKVKRKPSSCPVLFAWSGERFDFVTDFLGVGGVGFFVAPGEYAPPDPTEDVRIPPNLIEAREGKYLLRVAEPLEEVTYFDALHLIAYDHPASLEIYPDERFTASPPFPTGRPFAVADKLFPRAATNERGEDVLERILTIDRRYTEPVLDERFTGYAKDHWLELDFGDQLRGFPPEACIVLYLYGWVEYTYSHVNYAAWQAGVQMRSPYIEVPSGHGEWRVAMPEAGFPAGLPRMMTLDISALPIREEGRFRIRTNMEVFWDQVFIGEDRSPKAVRMHKLKALTADLRPLGYPREYSPDGANPTLYDYHRLDHGVPFKNMIGHFTRFGDTRGLLSEVDDQFVIMARGEELVLEFDAQGLPELPPDWNRTLVLHCDGYCKDMDLYTAYPDTVEPLPYRAMKNYPPQEPKAQPPAHSTPIPSLNTRLIAKEITKQALPFH